MNIDLRKFVDINIQEHVHETVYGTRDVVALFTDYGEKGKTYPEYNNPEKSSNIVVNMQDAHSKYDSYPEASTLLQYLEVYFEHGGSKVAVYEGYDTLTKEDVLSLPDEQICVAYASSSDVYSLLSDLAVSINEDSNVYGIKEKMIFARTTSYSDASSIKNFAVKYSSHIGAEMTMMAYLSKIDVYAVDTVYDYAFTQEVLPAENISNVNFDSLMDDNINVNIMLANVSRACGGNCKDGVEITNNFVRIVLHQTLTARLLQVLTQKIQSNSGISKLYTAIAQEMTYYLSCGYLTTDKVWSDETLQISHNGQNYTIIEKGTALINGYIVKILPMSSLSNEDKQMHRAPLIYLLVADQYSIRKITVNGEVI